MAFLDETGLSHLMQKIKDADNELNKKIPQPSTENPKPLGVAATSGTSETWARADHVHKRPALSAGNSATEGEFVSIGIENPNDITLIADPNHMSIIAKGNQIEFQIKDYQIPAATSVALGGIKLGYSKTGQNYPVLLNSENQAYVNVPWTDDQTWGEISGRPSLSPGAASYSVLGGYNCATEAGNEKTFLFGHQNWAYGEIRQNSPRIGAAFGQNIRIYKSYQANTTTFADDSFFMAGRQLIGHSGQYIFGQWNESPTLYDSEKRVEYSNKLFVIGNGGSGIRSDAFYITQSGNAYIQGSLSIGRGLSKTLTVGSKIYNGTNNITITASDLGLSQVMKFLGVTETLIEDGSEVNPIRIEGLEVTVDRGEVVLYNGYEYVWTGFAWERLGQDSSFKKLQVAVNTPVSNGTAIDFVDTIKQNEEGVITATRKQIQTATVAQKGIVQLSNTIDNTETKAATPKSVQTVQTKVSDLETNINKKLSTLEALPLKSGTGEESLIAGNIEKNIASAKRSFAFGGRYVIKDGEGNESGEIVLQATAEGAFATGIGTIASGQGAHTEGIRTVASQNGAHAEGSLTTASGYYSHAGGENSTAGNKCAFVHGIGLTSTAQGQTVFGQYNDRSASTRDKAFILGWGTNDVHKNIFTVSNTGAGVFTSSVSATSFIENGTSLSNKYLGKEATAAAAKKVNHILSITIGATTTKFDGSADKTVNISTDNYMTKEKYDSDNDGIVDFATALKVDDQIGTPEQPVYIGADGLPVPIAYTISASVPANAKFTDKNYYHSPAYTAGLQIASGSGVKAMYVPQATGSTLGVVKVDTSISSSSANPVQNKVIYSALEGKVNATSLAKVATSGSYNDLADTPSFKDTNDYHAPIYNTGLKIGESRNSDNLKNLYVPVATTDTLGVAKIYEKRSSTLEGNVLYGAAGANAKYYGVELTSDNKMFVNVPWVNTTYKQATTSTLGLVKPKAVRSTAITATTGETTSNRYYGVELDSNGQMFVNVPWSSGSGATITKKTIGWLIEGEITFVAEALKDQDDMVYLPGASYTGGLDFLWEAYGHGYLNAGGTLYKVDRLVRDGNEIYLAYYGENGADGSSIGTYVSIQSITPIYAVI